MDMENFQKGRIKDMTGKWCACIHTHMQKYHETYIIQITIHQLDLEAFMSFITIEISKLKYCHRQCSFILSARDKPTPIKCLVKNMSATSKS
jgi:hypothetical protein